MAKVVAEYGAAVIIMHIKGTPRNMQQDPVYDDVIGEIIGLLQSPAKNVISGLNAGSKLAGLLQALEARASA